MGKMSADITLARNLAKLQKTLAAAGVATPEVKITKELTREARSHRPDPTYEAEAVLKFLEKPARFMQKQCGYSECEKWFGTNYRAVGYCSDNHRIKALAQMGILWDPSKRPEDRWGGEPPLVIPPEALKVLIQMAQEQLVEEESDLFGPHAQANSSGIMPLGLTPEHMNPQIAEAVVHETIEHFLPQQPTSNYEFQLGDFDAEF